jgi:hypothetical protein
LPFCGETVIPMTWAAIKREGESWITLDAEAGHAEFTATSKVTVAYGGANETRVYSATANELSQVRCFPEWEATKVLEGNVRDVPASDRFIVSLGPITVSTTPFAAFIPEGPLNLVARTANMVSGEPQKIILRQGINLPTGSEIPVLDFSSAEARGFLPAEAIILGASSAFFMNRFHTWGSSHDLSAGNVGTAGIRHYAVPEELLAPDDYHTVEIRDVTAGIVNMLFYHYRRPRTIELEFGPRASAPTGEVLQSVPCTRMRANVPGQTSYPSFVVVRFIPDNGSLGNVEVAVTRDFLGHTPSTWSIEMPDIQRPDGGCLLPANLTAWGMMVTPQEGRIALFLGGKGLDGDMRRSSTVFWTNP